MNNEDIKSRNVDTIVDDTVHKMSGFSIISNTSVRLWKAMLAGVFVAGLVGALAFVVGFDKGRYIPQLETEAALIADETTSNGFTCDYTGTTKPSNQGLLDYTVYSDASSQTTDNKVAMSRRFSVVDKNLASQYLILNDIGDHKMSDVVFSMLEYYECIIPDWLYEKLEGLYLVKYQDENVARASVMVLEDRETAIMVAEILLSAATEDLEFRTVNGNYVAYTTQNAYWWVHDNLIIRIASHTTPTKADRNGVVQESSHNFSVCETLDVVDGMVLTECVHDQFWREVPEDILYAYLAKLPSDGDEVSWPEPGTPSGHLSASDWPTQQEFQAKQMSCDPEKEKKMMEAFEMFDNFDKEKRQAKTASRLDDGVKITHIETDKRWYYLGETVTISADALSVDGEFGNVYVDVKNDIFPNPEFSTVGLEAIECGQRVPFIQQKTGVKAFGPKSKGLIPEGASFGRR